MLNSSKLKNHWTFVVSLTSRNTVEGIRMVVVVGGYYVFFYDFQSP